mmetsp:Transcript_21343/g.37921  ORF Transcript_21343/g.37921 Transcript_21343/m.37921 type:complete len:238 (+) Transcript_21343:34-747(+)
MKSKEPPFAISKEPLQPLTIFWGGATQLDIRISAAYENGMDLPEDMKTWTPESARLKNRISYRFQKYQVDITEVFRYPDLSAEQIESLIKEKEHRMALAVGSEVKVYSYSRRQWQLGKVSQVKDKYLKIKLHNGGEKKLDRHSVYLAHKDHNITPIVSYEVEVELLPGVLSNEDTREEVIFDWMRCMFHLRKQAMLPLERRPQRPAQGHLKRKRPEDRSQTASSANKAARPDGGNER